MLFFILQQTTGIFVALLWAERLICDKSRTEFCIACPKFVVKKRKMFSQLERAWYFNCQQHRESVNIKTFDQSQYDTRIWYYGTAASKACLQAPPRFPLPSPPPGLLRSPIFFAVSPSLLTSSATAEPAPRLINNYSSSPNELWVGRMGY